jgi:hypothetical protein
VTAAVEITPAMVLEVTPVRQGAAERIAVYATLRVGGALVADARREIGVTEGTARRYERFLPALCAHLGVPVPRRSMPDFRAPRDGTGRGGHARWHVGRGVVSPDCGLCRDGVR